MRREIEAQSSGLSSHERNSLAAKQDSHLSDESAETLARIVERDIVESLGKLSGAGTESEDKPAIGECVNF